MQVQSRTSSQRWRYWFYLLGRKAKWMLTTLVAPEIMMGKAMVDRWSAGYSKKRMIGYAEHDGVEWGVSHGFLANMGGWCLRFPDDLRTPSRGNHGLDTVQGTPKGLEEWEPSNGAARTGRAATMPALFSRKETLRDDFRRIDSVSQSTPLRRVSVEQSYDAQGILLLHSWEPTPRTRYCYLLSLTCKDR